MVPRDDTTPARVAGGRRPPAADPGEFRFSPRPNRAHEIAWRPWGAAAFAAARDGRRPVLLSISAIWCHWCHVMDETTYSDQAVIDLVNEHFVAVRVDNDRRPDVNRRYNMGGWPTTAFLTADGEVITGATYLPAPQMLNALTAVSAFYAEHGAELRERPLRPKRVEVRGPRTDDRGPGEEDPGGEDPGGRDTGGEDPGGGAADVPAVETRAGAARRDRPARADEAGPHLTSRIVEDVVREVARLYDPLHGGLGTEPKFPQPDALSLLLTWGWRHGDGRLLDMALASLRAMADGDVYDRVEDGFFRYATRRDWSEPHYEKMLEDNARLALLYLDATAATGDRRYADVAGGVVDYVTGTLRLDDAPVFAGSQDADEVYFRLPAEGRARSATIPPVDATAYVEWNALFARTLLRASRALGRDGLEDLGLATLDHLWDNGFGRHGMVRCLPPSGATAHDTAAGGEVGGLIGDQAAMLAALLDAHETTGDRVHVARAEVLADWILAHLADAEGRLHDRPAVMLDGPAATAGPVPVIDAGSEVADGLLRLAAAAGRRDYGEAAARALRALADDYRGYGSFASGYALALMRLLDHPTHVAVVGRRDDERTRALRRAALALTLPQRTVASFDPLHDTEIVAREGYLDSDEPAAYVCAGGSCSAPVTDPAALTATAADAAAGPPATGNGDAARRAQRDHSSPADPDAR